MPKMNLTEATILALQGKLTENIEGQLEIDENGLPKLERPYSLRSRNDGRLQITSSHPYDLTDYSWAYFNLASIDYEENNIEGAIDNLEKTLEFNPKDIEAYKIYSKIMMKENQIDFAKMILERAIENCGGEGDLYYMQAQIAKKTRDREGFVKAMNNALKFNMTLSISPKLVKKELDDFLA